MTLAGACAMLFSAGAAMSTPVDMTIDLLLDICAAPTVEGASVKGDKLGWPRLSGAAIDDWRRHFLSYNRGTVDVVGWRRNPKRDDESLSFWIAVGSRRHTACAYSVASGGGHLVALYERLGKPDVFDKNDAVESISASWKRGSIQYSLTQVGSRMLINIGRQN